MTIHKVYRSILGIEADTIDTPVIHSMVHFWPILEPFLINLQPATLAEIGSSAGHLTDRLAAFAESTGGHLTVIDPGLDANRSGAHVTYAPMLSRDYIAEAEAPVALFIDGDHNYETVHMESKWAFASPKCRVIFFHDVGFPYARRDAYYDESTVDNPHDASWYEEPSLSDTSDGLKRPDKYDIAYARQWGGARNGVLTAIEDALEAADDDWQYQSIPSIFGLGIAIRRSSLAALSEKQREAVSFTLEALKAIRPFFGTLEANRLRLIEEYKRNTWEKDALMHEKFERDQERHELLLYADTLHKLSRLPVLGRLILWYYPEILSQLDTFLSEK